MSERGIKMWRFMLHLIAMRPDPSAGRRKMMSIELNRLENQAEKAALKCIKTHERLQALRTELGMQMQNSLDYQMLLWLQKILLKLMEVSKNL